MADDFVPLSMFLRGDAAAVVRMPSAPAAAMASVAVENAAAPGDDDVSRDDDVRTAIRQLTLMRLAAFEAFERAATALLATFASDVLGRELALAPADVEALARAAVASCGEEPVTLFLCAQDAERVRTALPVRVDPSLTAGDLVVEVRDGALESRLSFRVAAACKRALSETR